MQHNLKILRCYFEPVLSGDKTFEIRDNSDRGFQKGDVVVLMEIDKDLKPTGRSVTKRITYVTGYAQKPEWVVFGIASIN